MGERAEAECVSQEEGQTPGSSPCCLRARSVRFGPTAASYIGFADRFISGQCWPIRGP